jgi:site-specific DNA-methyltransferase (adenine-specific)
VIDAFLGAGFELRGQVARVVKTLRGGDRPKGAHKRFPEVSVTPRSCWEPWLIFRRPCEGLVRDNLRKWHTGALRRPSKGTPFSDLIVAGPARGAERKIAPHPSVKPQVLMRQLVAAALPLRTGVVLDPFMGSGSTLAAAEALGFRSIGIELNTAYFNLARRAIPRLASLEVILPAAPASGARRSSTRAPSSHNGSAGGGQRPAARGREPT